MPRRRQTGEGHYYRDGDYHCFRIKHNGKQIVRKAKSSSELREKVHTLQRELRETGSAEGRRRIGIDRYLDKWLESQAPRWDDTTLRSYRRNVGYLKKELGTAPIEKLRPTAIDTAMNSIKEKHGGRTAELCFAVLRGALNFAVRDGLIVANPCRLTSPPKYRKKPVRLLDIDELQAIDNSLEGRFAPLLRLVIYSGLRISEVVKLRVFDVNLKKREIRVEDSKSESGDRTVPLVAPALAAVRAALEQRAADASKRPWVDSGRLFTTITGRPQSARNASRALDKAVERSGIVGKASPHDFRRAFGSHLGLAKEPVSVVQKLMGHKDPSTTQAYYQLANELAMRATVDRLPYAKDTDEDTEEAVETRKEQRKKRI